MTGTGEFSLLFFHFFLLKKTNFSSRGGQERSKVSIKHDTWRLSIHAKPKLLNLGVNLTIFEFFKNCQVRFYLDFFDFPKTELLTLQMSRYVLKDSQIV
jgi:hypothetical protein